MFGFNKHYIETSKSSSIQPFEVASLIKSKDLISLRKFGDLK